MILFKISSAFNQLYEMQFENEMNVPGFISFLFSFSQFDKSYRKGLEIFITLIVEYVHVCICIEQ